TLGTAAAEDVEAFDPAGSAAAAQAHAVQRANHTGTQAISTVSGLQAALDGKETAGAAAAAVIAHESDPDPHPQYVTAAEVGGLGKHAETIGDGSETEFTIAHNLGTRDVQVSLR